MNNARKFANILLNKAFTWSAKSLAVAAVLILGKSDEAKAELNLAGKDESFTQEKVGGDDHVSYVEVGDVGEDWGDDTPPKPE